MILKQNQKEEHKMITTTIRYRDEKTMQTKVKTYKCSKDTALKKFGEFCLKNYGYKGCLIFEIKQQVFNF